MRQEKNNNLNKRTVDLTNSEHLTELFDAYVSEALGSVSDVMKNSLFNGKLMTLAKKRMVNIGLIEYGDSMFHKTKEDLEFEMLDELADALVYGFAVSVMEDGVVESYLRNLSKGNTK